MRKVFLILILASGIIFTFSAAAPAAGPSAAETFKKMRENIKSLQSFSYLVKEDDG